MYSHKILTAGLLVILFMLVLQPDMALSQIGNGPGTNSASILDIAVGSRASGLGGAYTAFSEDAYASFWNPAGLSCSESMNFSFGYSDWYSDISINSLGAAIPLSGRFALGMGLLYVNYGDFEGYSLDDTPTGDFSGHNLLTVLSLSFSISENISIGGTFKGISEKLEESSASTIAFDIGGKLRTGPVRFGLVLKNLGSGLKYEYERSPLPTKLTAGIGLITFENKLNLAVDIDIPRDSHLSIHQGMEYLYLNTIYLRGGYSHNFGLSGESGKNGLVYGFGLKVLSGTVDYSYIPDGDFGGLHELDFSVKLDR